MVLRRDEVLRLVNELPEEVDVDDLIHRLHLRQKLAAAERDVEVGRTLSIEEVRQQSREWPT